MAHVATDTEAQPAIETSSRTSLVDWSAAIAGAVLAAAISFVLLTFGTAIGLSATSPWPNSGLPTGVVASLAVFWAMALQIGAFLAGGYVAGRMRARLSEARTNEVEFRDGLHGGLVWALGVVIGAALALAAGGTLARTGAETGASTVSSLSSTADPMEMVLDAMLRPAAGKAPLTRTESPAGDARAELTRILTSSIGSGGLSDQDRTYLAQRVSQLAGLSLQDAENRVKEALSATRRAADRARRTAILTGFVTAASLMISLGAAWWAAAKGGQHRDNETPARFAFGEHGRRPISGS